jgi:hypothetical protein
VPGHRWKGTTLPTPSFGSREKPLTLPKMARTVCASFILLAIALAMFSSTPLSARTVDDHYLSIPNLAAAAVTPAADAYVDLSNPTANYGTGTTLRVDGSPTVQSFLRFSVQNISGTVSKVTLRVYANSSQSTGYSAYRVADNTWGETTITYQNEPPLGSVVGSSGPVTGGMWAAVDVTSYVTGNGTWSLALATSNSTAMSLASREAGANAPQLVIETGSSTPTATAAPSPTRTNTLITVNTSTATATKLPPTATWTATMTSSSSTSTRTATLTTGVAIATATRTATFAPTATASGGSSVTFAPVADAYVDASKPTTNNGATSQLKVDGSPVTNSYLRFDVQGLNGPIIKATLSLYALASSSTSVAVRSVNDNTWGETTITYQNAPPISATAIGSLTAITKNKRTTVDVTAYITGNGTWSLALTTTSSSAKTFASQEAGANGPQLILQIGAGPTATSTATPTMTNIPLPPSLTPTNTAPAPTATDTATSIPPAVSPTSTPAPTATDTPTIAVTPTSILTDTPIPPTPTNTPLPPTATYTPTGTPLAATATLTGTSSPVPPTNTTAPTPTPAPGTYLFLPSADAYVDSSNPATNYGTLNTIKVDGSPIVNSYLRFDVQGLSGPVSKAVLRIYTFSTSTTGYSVQGVADNTWGETTINYNNAPTLSPAIGYSGSIISDTWTLVDITSFVNREGTFSLALSTTSTSSKTFGSRESGSNSPRLEIYIAAPTSTPTATPTGGASTITPTSTFTPSGSPTPTATPILSGGDPVLAGAGDIACDPVTDLNYNGGLGTANSCHMKATSDLILQMNPNAVFTSGDNQYEDGALTKFQLAFDSAWGRFKSIIHPAPGNHEYNTLGAADYFTYFGASAGTYPQGYYSYDLGAWHIVVVNSNCSNIGGCSAGSPQEQWLRNDLAAHPTQCTLAYWHHPLFSSGQHGNNTFMQPIWQALEAYGADLVVNSHDHIYERFAPQTDAGIVSPNGIQEIIVGTGGESHYSITALQPNSLVQNTNTYGVLVLVLHPSSYDWYFVPEAGKTFSDSGTGTCH